MRRRLIRDGRKEGIKQESSKVRLSERHTEVAGFAMQMFITNRYQTGYEGNGI